MLFLEEPFKTAWENKDPFSEIQLIKGQIYRKIDTRQTLNFLFNGQSFYIKIHEGTTVKEFLKNIFCLRLPTWGACTEYKAIQRLHDIDFTSLPKNHKFSCIPTFYGAFTVTNFIGFEQECYLSKEQGGIYDFSCFLEDYILDLNNTENLIFNLLNQLKTEMLSQHIVCSDLHPWNILYVEKGTISKLVIIDGFGTTELIPYYRYINFFAKQKINRQWSKLQRRLLPIFEKRNAIYTNKIRSNYPN